MIDLSKHKLELTYPCEWCYKIVVLDQHDPHAIAQEVFSQRPHKVTHSKTSTKGKFKSANIDLLVHNDDDRIFFHEALRAHKDIKMVL